MNRNLTREDDQNRCGSNLFELTRRGGERELGGESDSEKEMSYPRRRLTASCVFNNHRTCANRCYT